MLVLVLGLVFLNLVLVFGWNLVLEFELGFDLALVLVLDFELVDGDHRRAYLIACLDSWGSSSV